MRWPSGELRGAAAASADLDALRALIVRYAEQAEALVLRLFPHYRGQLTRGNSSFRPSQVATRVTSWRKDDTRLHIDAFPSNPMHGTRLLRVFSNVNPSGQPREWRVGEPFEDARPALPAGDPSTAAGHRVPAACQRHHETPTHRIRSCDAATA